MYTDKYAGWLKRILRAARNKVFMFYRISGSLSITSNQTPKPLDPSLFTTEVSTIFGEFRIIPYRNLTEVNRLN